jgi:Resolvase, N terminal domain
MKAPKEGTPAKAVGIWIRVSTEDQARGESPEHHEKRARHYAEAKGWKVREVYNLSGVSGKSVKPCPLPAFRNISPGWSYWLPDSYFATPAAG